MHFFSEGLVEVLIDTAKLLPFLFVTYLVMEYLEHRTEERSVSLLGRAGVLGPLFGGAAGVVPQCGFSAASSGLFSGGLITLGTLLAVYLSTSDEMLPILISESVHPATIGKILATKVLLAIISGFAVDGFLRMRKTRTSRTKDFHEQCERDDCHCEEGNVVKSALIHTLKIALFIFLISLVLEFLIHLAGEEAIAGFLTGRPVVGVLLAGLVGLIPNCAASVAITELYVKGLLGAGQMMAGLLVGAGVGLLVLFRSNRDLRENLKIVAVLYGIGVLWGLLIEAAGVRF